MDKIIELYNKGASIREIAKQLDVNKTTIRRRLAKYDLLDTSKISFICNKCNNPITGKWARNRAIVFGSAECYECGRLNENEKRQNSRRRNVEYVLKYLINHPCVDCGETDLLVLEFDHIKDRKIAGVLALAQSAYKPKIDAEIAKCEVRCANCHKKRTAKQFNTQRYRFVVKHAGVVQQ